MGTLALEEVFMREKTIAQKVESQLYAGEDELSMELG